MTSIAEHIDQAADQLRTANHLTHHGHLDGPTAAVVVGNLAELIGRLPQLVDHLRRGINRVRCAEHYDCRPGISVADTFWRALDHLDEASQMLDHLDGHVRAAYNDLGHIGRHLTEED